MVVFTERPVIFSKRNEITDYAFIDKTSAGLILAIQINPADVRLYALIY